GAAWSLLRNRLSALACQSGAWGFTCGVEWLATEKIDVHGNTGLRWGQSPNLLREIKQINDLLRNHPCFFDGARVTRLSGADSWILALERESASGEDRCLALLNLDPVQERSLDLGEDTAQRVWDLREDLLGHRAPAWEGEPGGPARITLPPARSVVLAARREAAGLAGEAYRAARAQAAWALRCLEELRPVESLGASPWQDLAVLAGEDPFAFLASLAHLPADLSGDLCAALREARTRAAGAYPAVVPWERADARRVTPVPLGHWVLVEDDSPFLLHLEQPTPVHLRAIPARGRWVAAFHPGGTGPLTCRLESHAEGGCRVQARFDVQSEVPAHPRRGPQGLALLTNGRGAYARLHAGLGHIESKYDALLAANLHPAVPCDRHVLVKRLRGWAIADGFLTALDQAHLLAFEGGPRAHWRWALSAGDGRQVGLSLEAWMPPDRNEVRLRLLRAPGLVEASRALPPGSELRVTLRLDLEDRGFHGETTEDPGLDAHFQDSTTLLEDRPGFRFAPAGNRILRIWTSEGLYHPEPEWCLAVPHPLEAQRAQRSQGDAWSPGWFELVLEEGVAAELTVSAEAEEQTSEPPPSPPSAFGERLEGALEAFIARRGSGSTIIAGYPWFLDWGRDALVACRGLLAAGRGTTALGILQTFGALEREGTLPNTLAGEGEGNRDTSDAPLWFALACEEAVALLGPECLEAKAGTRSLREVRASIAQGYLAGTPGGVRVDLESGLVWSPPHFTWMDTNHPAGSPREGFPIELQALWLRLVRQLEHEGRPGDWNALAVRVEASLDRYWLEERGFYADVLHGGIGSRGAEALPDDHLRPNQLLGIALGCLEGPRARRATAACARHLLVPGAMRSLAPLPVSHPLPIRGAWGQALNDPHGPYWGTYEGDEDTRRKPAYHNGTAWVWWLPIFCEALAAAWPGDRAALGAARAYLGTVAGLLDSGCRGHLPEILDGDAPHTPRGCDAQAWSASEALRVWRRLERLA
ncbi:MAG: glycogen debranching enzyme N-terminal domain-containing protein, partial [Acidobacteria bacterium]|nr:glycogen debranching enzyme N-terminal domain-containing protein [Acidobacteriota bacterium]